MDFRTWLIITLTIPCITGFPTELDVETYNTDFREHGTISFLSRNQTTYPFPYGFSRIKRQASGGGSCRKAEFQCNNKKCISSSLKCDGKRDCTDGSDETITACMLKNCPSYLFRCNYGACVDGDARCNKIQDCADNSDEIGCPGSSTIAPIKSNCRKTEFSCKNGECIEKKNLCNGKADCTDVSDETVAVCSQRKCAAYLFTCAYGACIEDELKCNHVSDCFDSSDEWISLCGEGFVDPASVGTTTSTTTIRTVIFNASPCTMPEIPENGKYKVLGSNFTPAPNTEVPYETTLEFMCKNKNYTVDGQHIVKCQDGDWFPAIPGCKKLCAHVQSATTVATCQYKGKSTSCEGNLKHDTIVRYSCKAKHYFRDYMPPRTCIDGTWDYPLPKCVAECGEEPGAGTGLILGGTEATNGTFPWHVGIYNNLVSVDGSYIQACGGTIIRNNIVVSAAHCFYNESGGQSHHPFFYRVAAGKFYRDLENEIDQRTSYFQISSISNILIPEEYGGNNQQQQSDISLLVLETPFNFSQFVVAACMELTNSGFDKQQLNSNNMGKAAGWGVTSEGGIPSEVLKVVDLPVILYNECRNKLPETFRRYLTTDKYCAGYTNGTSVCSGDSGGGMVFQNLDQGTKRWYLRGIVSVGVPSDRSSTLTCRNDTYSAFTRVFTHREWILEKLTEFDKF